MFRPFSGLEEPPLAPGRLAGEADAAYSRRVDRDEWRAAWGRWREAYLRLRARGSLTAMAVRWGECSNAHAEMTEAFDRLVAEPDGRWRANINMLLEARGEALVVAASWDEDTAKLLGLAANDPKLRELDGRAEGMYGPMGAAAGPYRGWDRAARDLGIDTSGWVIVDGQAYRGRIEREIALQDTRIDQINRLSRQAARPE